MNINRLNVLTDATYGTAGTLTYTVEGTDTQIEVMWSVPMIYGVYSNRFNVQVTDVI